jgi:hypothetical protein
MFFDTVAPKAKIIVQKRIVCHDATSRFRFLYGPVIAFSAPILGKIFRLTH